MVDGGSPLQLEGGAAAGEPSDRHEWPHFTRFSRSREVACPSLYQAAMTTMVDDKVREGSDACERPVPRLLGSDELRRFSKIDGRLSVLHIALEWSLIVACACLTWRFWHPALYLAAVAFIGARQHALLVLVHEAAHGRLFKNRRLNDWVGEALLSWPLVLVKMRDYRRTHFAHHRSTNTERDPDWMRKQSADWTFPMPAGALLRMLARDLLGLGVVGLLFDRRVIPPSAPAQDRDDVRMRILRPILVVALIAAAVAAGLGVPLLLFWVVPFVTWLQVIMRVRSIAEHFAIDGREGVYAETRTTLPNWFERVFVAPKNINYHFEHHLYPTVPCHRLAALHQRLMELPEHRRALHVTHGYWRVLLECVRRPSLEARSLGEAS